MLNQVCRRLALLVSLTTLSGCDPGVHVAWKDTFQRQIDRNCIEDAVKSVAGKTTHSYYESEGEDFPHGVKVYQIMYEQPFNDMNPHLAAGCGIDIAPLRDGSMGYIHRWGKLGTTISSAEMNYVTLVMTKVNAAVARRCGVAVGNGNPVQGKG
ncbi:hypothetical protein [Sphingomonas phyllosphaerae]|uniref:hypothetical protein n=1 Tax=Sphingomonas phyllosphaerae TaxID=257003 RepID=UPI0024130CE0|nr:hypothetical protein [Sphingomonas phyllosphaerae]